MDARTYRADWYAPLVDVGPNDPKVIWGYTMLVADDETGAREAFAELLDVDLFDVAPGTGKGGVFRIVVDPAFGTSAAAPRIIPVDLDSLPDTWNFTEAHLVDLVPVGDLTFDIDAAVAEGMREISVDILVGTVPLEVNTFAWLHDFVDANEYAGCCTTRSDWPIGAVAEVQNRLDVWLGRREPDYCEGCERRDVPVFEAHRLQWCADCIAVMPPVTLVENFPNGVQAAKVRGMAFRADAERGAWYEADDPTPGGTVGRFYIPMLLGGLPDVANVNEIGITYDEAARG